MDLTAPAAPPPGAIGAALTRRKWCRSSPPLTFCDFIGELAILPDAIEGLEVGLQATEETRCHQEAVLTLPCFRRLLFQGCLADANAAQAFRDFGDLRSDAFEFAVEACWNIAKLSAGFLNPSQRSE